MNFIKAWIIENHSAEQINLLKDKTAFISVNAVSDKTIGLFKLRYGVYGQPGIYTAWVDLITARELMGFNDRYHIKVTRYRETWLYRDLVEVETKTIFAADVTKIFDVPYDATKGIYRVILKDSPEEGYWYCTEAEKATYESWLQRQERVKQQYEIFNKFKETL